MSRKRFSQLAAFGVAMALVAAACGDDGDDGAGAGDTTAAPTTAAATTAAPGTASATTATATTVAAAEPWTCVDPNAPEPADGDSFVFSWGPGSTGDGVIAEVVPLVKESLGLDMEYVGAPSSDTMAQIIGQGGAGDYDVVFTSYGPLEQGRAAGVYEEIDFDALPEVASLPEDKRDPAGENYAITTSEFAYGLAYNTDTLAAQGLPEPTKVEDMLDPQYASILGLYTPPFAGAVSQIAVINSILGGPPDDMTTGIEALAGIDGAQQIANSGAMDNAFAAGDVGMYFSASATVQTFLDDGVPVKMVYDPAYGTGIYAFVPKGAKNVGAACTFLNWVASVEGQEALQAVNGNLPTRRDGVTLRPDTVLSEAAGQEILSYPDLIAEAPSAEEITEQWNIAFG
jgi:spermidine/putrescine-binding protein